MALQVIKSITTKYPITRGMLVYAGMWPGANIVQQLTSDKEEFDLQQMVRFGLFGCFFTAPTLYVWMKFSSRLIQGQSVIIGIKKAMLEQVTYGPFALTSFLVGMGALEGKSCKAITHELEMKFLPTWKRGVLFWPVVQTVNFAFIKEKNRVPFVSVFSFIWTCYLSWVKSHPVKVIESQPIIPSPSSLSKSKSKS